MAKKKLSPETRLLAVTRLLRASHQPHKRGLARALTAGYNGALVRSADVWIKCGCVSIQTYTGPLYPGGYSDAEIVQYRERDTEALKEACTELGFPYVVQ